MGDGKSNLLSGMENDPRHSPPLTFRPSTFSAVSLRCGRAFLAVFALASLVFLSVDNALAQGSVAEDTAALTALYDATGGANWTDSTNWKSTEALSAWYGVSTNADGRVTQLSLHGNELSGEIPAELGDLTNLQQLSLSRNTLSGEIPAELGDLTNLQQLSLDQNQLSGEIPAELGDLTNLQRLYLWRNQLTGTIPAGRLDQPPVPVSPQQCSRRSWGT